MISFIPWASIIKLLQERINISPDQIISWDSIPERRHDTFIIKMAEILHKVSSSSKIDTKGWVQGWRVSCDVEMEEVIDLKLTEDRASSVLESFKDVFAGEGGVAGEVSLAENSEFRSISSKLWWEDVGKGLNRAVKVEILLRERLQNSTFSPLLREKIEWGAWSILTLETLGNSVQDFRNSTSKGLLSIEKSLDVILNWGDGLVSEGENFWGETNCI